MVCVVYWYFGIVWLLLVADLLNNFLQGRVNSVVDIIALVVWKKSGEFLLTAQFSWPRGNKFGQLGANDERTPLE